MKYFLQFSYVCIAWLLLNTHTTQAETYLVNGPVNHNAYEDVQYLKNVDISIVEMNETHQRRVLSAALQPNDSRSTLQLSTQKWHVELTNYPKIWAYDALRPVTIAIIDTGINAELLSYKNVAGGPNYIEDAAAPIDDHGHGTALASIMLDVTGELPIELVPIKAANDRGNFTIANIVQAIDYAIERQVDIINLSFGATTPHSSEQQAIEKALAAGITVISSAGNNGKKQYFYPASYPGVISIGAINDKLERSSFSSYNNRLDFVAPGEALSVFAKDQLDPLTTVNGTSFASAYFSGVFGILKALSFIENTHALQPIAQDLGDIGYDLEYGFGFVEPLNALLTLRGIPWTAQSTSEPQKTWRFTFSQPLEVTEQLEHIQLLDATLQPLPYRYEIQQHTLAITPTTALPSGDYWLIIPKELQSTTTNLSRYPTFVKFTVAL